MAQAFATTAPGKGRTQETEAIIPEVAFAIAFSLSEQPREGEVGFLLGDGPWLLGRGGPGNYVWFHRQLPGEPPPARVNESCLGGPSLSRLQARVWLEGNVFKIKNLGTPPMYVNRVKVEEAVLTLGTTVHFENEVVLVFVNRPKVLPGYDGPITHACGQPDANGLVTESASGWGTRTDIALAARMDDNLIIFGESGTGKQLVGGAIHRRSKRHRKEMLTVNASVRTETLNQQNYFGNLKGFPNSDTPAREGYFTKVAGGALFMDEIGDCPEDVQVNLLLALQDGHYQVLGDPAARTIDVRVMGATNKDPKGLRGDFFGRFPRRIYLTPLRDRREDIALLLRRELIAYAKQLPDPQRILQEWPDGNLYPRVSARLVEYIVSLPLPRNIRDLEGLASLAVDKSLGGRVEMFTEPVLRTIVEPTWGPQSVAAQTAPTASPAPGPSPASVPPASRPRSSERPSLPPTSSQRAPSSPRATDPTRDETLAALEHEWWSIRATAKRLGVSEPRLYRLMERYGIKRPAKPGEPQ